LGVASNQSVARTVDKPAKLEFYIMAKCPYGVQVEKAIGPVLDQLGANVDFHVGYIGQKNGDDLSSMHGPGAVTGDIAQLCAHEVAPDKYFKMILCQDKDPQHVDTNWESCGQEAGIDTGAVKACMDTKGKQLLAAAFDEAKARHANGSPTMFLNGKPYNGGRKSNDFLRAICNSFEGSKPEACANIPVPVKVSAIFFSDARCEKCNIDSLEGRLKGIFEGLQVRKVDYSSSDGKALYAELQKADPSFKYLPVVLFDSSVDGDKDGKQQIARYIHPVGQYQALALGHNFDPTAEICDNKVDDDANGKVDCDDATCQQAMACRPEKPKTLDLFVMAHCPFGTKAMIAAKDFSDAFGQDVDISVHYIGDDRGGTLSSMHGPTEVADDLREICAEKYYAKDRKFLDFLACRSKNVRDEDWKKCTGSNGIDANVIQKCVDTEAKDLLSKSFALAKALDISASPTFLVNNRETFNAQDPNGIKVQYCKHNPGLAGCDKQLTSSAPAGSAPSGGACGK
jgi:predicted DsbA family dithiol-disulfide isomerase